MKLAKSQKGFTLIELITAVSIFVIVMTVSMGSIVNIFDANRQSRSLRTVTSNLNLATESMSKEMRYGKIYHCGSGTVTEAQNCPEGSSTFSFLSSSRVQTTYRLNGSVIEKQEDGGEFAPITAPEAIIDSITFYTVGAGAGDNLQPKVLIKISAHAGTKNPSSFDLETLVSQRSLDI